MNRCKCTSASAPLKQKGTWGPKVVMWLHKAQSCEKEAAVCSCAGSSVQLQNCKEKHKQK